MLHGLYSQALYTIHKGQVGGRGLSPRIWADATGMALSPDGYSNAFAFSDDFVNFGGAAPSISGTTSGTTDGYGYYVDTATSACSITSQVGRGGTIKIATGATDNHEAWMTTGGNTGTLGSIDASDLKLTAFEARVKFSDVTSMNAFVGLAEEGLAAADTVSNAGVMADKDYIGFSIQESDSDAVDFVYRKAGSSEVVALTFATSLVADQWYKFGFLVDPKAQPSKRIRIFIDNVEQATTVSQTSMEASTFPSGEELAVLAGVKNGAAAVRSMEIDWLSFLQEG